ncbi:UDP-N-acetyl-D-galactosamine dehydrogenase [Rhodopseudomonas julia]|uniref:UDP-N-acetyl-D-galactosamine dehydrogenase n=1 Tax=Rhodopseudomonas julia TaxID=200617 RepID=A0ABU0C4Q4_9BRAD|nr:nucleotide sugar dehydrogenase [Rhodopseudomonas julia]MDQ0324939.1 UDP-N-acetyl-D-galactosamine dehydrogenase [Rhodopseudomonas julia]
MRGFLDRHRLSVLGLGYVGLPVAAAFARAGYEVIAFDIDADRVEELRAGRDRNAEVTPQDLACPRLHITSDTQELSRADIHIVTVPTPITPARRPDLRPLQSASVTVGRVLKAGDIVVYESTVYPGATEEVCVPILEAESGLRFGQDFAVGYSPERINPGDDRHRFETIAKVVSGSDAKTLDRLAELYGSVLEAEVHRAPSIRVAEAAKVIENTQRDLNIALMNELALIFDRLGLRTADVLAAARTKWNFVDFTPGLVGGHCIGVDPYYLTAKAEEMGHHPEVILAGRRTNDGMGAFIARKAVKLMIGQGLRVKGSRVGIFGLTFKENVSDLRNSRVPDIVEELRDYGITPLVHDPLAEKDAAFRAYGIELQELQAIDDLDAAIMAVPHAAYLADAGASLFERVRNGGVVVDVKSRFAACPPHLHYWSL